MRDDSGNANANELIEISDFYSHLSCSLQSATGSRRKVLQSLAKLDYATLLHLLLLQNTREWQQVCQASPPWLESVHRRVREFTVKKERQAVVSLYTRLRQVGISDTVCGNGCHPSLNAGPVIESVRQESQGCAFKYVRCSGSAPKSESKRSFGLEDDVAALKQIVRGQDTACEAVATAMYYHKKMAKVESYRQSPILLYGPSGCGKTYVVQQAVKQVGGDFLKVDASLLVPSGIVGTGVSDIGRLLLQQVGGDVGRAERAVVFLDEYDKLLKGVYPNVATQMLALLEGSSPLDIPQESGKPAPKVSRLNTDRMLFILGGCFGQDAPRPLFTTVQRLRNPETDDSELQLPTELRGRLGQIVKIHPISPELMKGVLEGNSDSPLVSLNKELGLFGSCCLLTDEAFLKLLKTSATSRFGVRGIFQTFISLQVIRDIRIRAPQEPGSTYIINADQI